MNSKEKPLRSDRFFEDDAICHHRIEVGYTQTNSNLRMVAWAFPRSAARANMAARRFQAGPVVEPNKLRGDSERE